MNARAYLFHLEQHGIKLGLDNIRHLLGAACVSGKEPQNTFPSIHLAGTNGKGSVAALIDTMAQCAGYQIGRFTSPHLLDVTERFLINGKPIPEHELDEHILFFQKIADTMPVPPTFFELTTAIAMRWFAQNQIDLGIIEVGMGGRLDSTNIISPVATAIISIGLDHTQYLGETVEKIAFEKAGICKPQVPLVLTERADAPTRVILEHAATLEVPVHQLGRDFAYTVSGTSFSQQFSYESATLKIETTPLALNGRHQGLNAAAAVTLANLVHPILPRISPTAIRQGLRQAHWPCRMERVSETPPILLDVAHNPAGAAALAQTIETEFDRCIVIFAASSDKDVVEMFRILAPLTSQFILTRYSGDRAMTLSALADALKSARPDHVPVLLPDLSEALAYGMKQATETSPLLITGSIFMVGEAREWLIRNHHAPELCF